MGTILHSDVVIEHRKKTLLGSLSENEPWAEICCDIGRHFMERKEYRTAASWYGAAASRKGSTRNGAFVNRDCYDYIPYMQLCVCYYWLGDIQQAKNITVWLPRQSRRMQQ